MKYYQRQIITTGTDDRGNKIQYAENVDGTWTDLYEECERSAEFVQQIIKSHDVIMEDGYGTQRTELYRNVGAG